MKARLVQYPWPESDIQVLRDGFRLGLQIGTIGRLTSVLIPGKTIHHKGKMLGLLHRNRVGRPQMLKQLAPEMMWGYSEFTWNDPVDLLQKAYRVSHQLTVAHCVECMADYHAALERFPAIPRLMENFGSRVFWWIDMKPWRPPHPAIESLREGGSESVEPSVDGPCVSPDGPDVHHSEQGGEARRAKRRPLSAPLHDQGDAEPRQIGRGGRRGLVRPGAHPKSHPGDSGRGDRDERSDRVADALP